MLSSQIRKDKVLAAIVRTFFKYFVTGIIETQCNADINERLNPKNIKETMLQHYENISKYFNKEVFFAIFRINYGQEEMERQLRSFMNDTTTDMDLVKFACRTEEFYQMMINEYKRNFEMLLLGHLETDEEHEKNYTRCFSAGMTSVELAEHIIEETASNAYMQGKEIVKQNYHKI